MNNIVKKVALGVVGLFLGLFVVGIVMGMVNANQRPTPESTYNTSKNGFVSGCVNSAADYQQTLASAGITAQNYCSCAFTQLDNYYKNQNEPQWYSDDNLINRIVTQGYTQAETDQLVSCVQ